MEHLLRFVATTCFALCVAGGQQAGGQLRPAMAYELYSWQQPNGSWSFSVLPSPSGVNTPAQAVFNKKFLLRGVEQLKRKIDELPEGSTIFWLDRVPLGSKPKAKGSDRLMYPPSNMLDQIKQKAAARQIQIQVLPSKRTAKE